MLSLVNGSRFHPLQRSRSLIPASCAIRSSSAGHTYRNGIEWSSKRPSTSSKWCDVRPWLATSNSSIPQWVGLAWKTRIGLARWQPPQLGHVELDDKTAAGLQVSGDVSEAGDLRRLGREVPDRVEDQVRERKGSLDGRRREVPDRDADVITAGLLAELGDHRLRQVDAVDRHSPLRERQRDPPGADPELERASIAGELGEEVDNGVEHRRIEHVRGGLVIPSSDPLVEVAVVVHRKNLTLSESTTITPPEPGSARREANCAQTARSPTTSAGS